MLRIKKEALTFDDVLLVPRYSDILPNSVNLSTKLTSSISLNIPIISAAMDTVTESNLAIALANEGGIGFIHKNMSIDKQVREINKVKKCKNNFIFYPITLSPEITIREYTDFIKKNNFAIFPVVKNKRLIGIINKDNVKLENNLNQPIIKIMTSKYTETAFLKESNDVILKKMQKKKLEKIFIVDDDFLLIGMIKIKDLKGNKINNLKTCKDKKGRLRVGAAVGIDIKNEDRIDALVDVGVDVLLFDSSHGHSKIVLNNIRKIRNKYPNLQIIAGNVVTGKGAIALVEEGVNAVKVGIGPGSICTTRVITGVGIPQITAISDVAEALKGTKIPIIADGGIRFSGDIAKAIAAGASCVMVGQMFAGTKESPGKKILFKGRFYKEYRGMGSLKSIKKGSFDRYFQKDNRINKIVPEGIEGKVLYKGLLKNVIYQQMGGLRSSMGLTGCKNIEELRTKSEFVKISNSGIKENHIHDIFMIKECPNYFIKN